MKLKTKLKTKLLILSVVLLLAIPLMLTGNASAVVYNPDGALLNGTTGLWELPQVACRGVSSSYWTAGDFSVDPGTAVTRTDLDPRSNTAPGYAYGTTGCYVPRSGFTGPYITYFANTYSGDATGANCMAAGFSWKSGSGCFPVYWQHAKNLAGTSWETTTSGTSYRSCTKCHNSTYMTVANGHSVEAGEVAEYVNASHKNASRKIVQGSGLANVWLDSNDVEQFGVFPYLPGLNSPSTAGSYGSTTTYNLRMVDWVNGKIEDTTANASFVGLRNLPTGVYTDWYWEFGYYGVDPERGTYNAIAKSNGQPSAEMKGCFFCHATGAVGSNTIDTTKEPERSFPGISWDTTTTYTPGSRPGVVNLRSQIVTRANRSSATADLPATYKYGQWDEFGVVCSSCHASSDGSHQNVAAAGQTIAWGSGTAIEGASINAVCGQCHVKGGSGNGTVTAPKTDQITLRKYVGTGHPNYHATDFLNSPHARFTGLYSEISDSTKYDSEFLTNEGGCTACHNPHGSARVELLELTEGTSAEPLEGIETTCAACHATTQASTPAITSINHPTGADTPDDTHDACVTCHMPSGRHLFRITTDANYTTTQPTAFPAKADGTLTEAVWIDMKSACGQCHSGHVVEEAPQLTNAQLAQAAAGMHGGELTTNCTACHTVFTKLPSKHPSGTGTPTACTMCHTTPHSGAVNTDTLCGQCHGGSAGPSATSNGAPYIGQSFLSAYAEDMHSNVTTPTASMDIDVSSYTVSLTDTSTDDKEFPAKAVKVNWGDGTTPSKDDAGGTIAHTYSADGKYTITYTVKDSDGLRNSKTITVLIPERFKIIVNLSPALSTNAKFILKKNGIIKAIGKATDSYTFKKLKPGTYQVKVKKLGYAFDGDAVTEENQNPLTVVVGASDQTVTFTHTP